jgi:hypothetical protein
MRKAVYATVLIAVFIVGCSRQDKAAAPPASTAVASAGAAATPQSDQLIFAPVTKTVSPGHASVVNGVPVKPGDWPTLLVAQISQKQPDGQTLGWLCTSTLVGPRTLLTAAHCVDGGKDKPLKTVQLKLGNGLVATTECVMHPAYAAAPFPPFSTPRNSADFALCYLQTDLQQVSDFQTLKYEVVDRQTSAVIGNPVLVTGYGCTSISLDPQGKPVFGPLDNTLRVGDASLSHLTGSGGDDERDYVQAHSVGPTQAALCPGDSGGPLITGATLKNQVGPRRVVGVNSSIAIASAQDLTSRFASLQTADFRAFSDAFLASHPGAFICGINRPAGSFPCRS